MSAAGLPVASRATVRRWVRAAAGEHRRSAAAVIGLQGGSTAAGLVFPHELGVLVAAATSAGPRHGVIRTALAVLVVALVVQAVLARGASRRASVLGEGVLADLRERFVDRVLDLPLGLVERAGTGDLLARASGDVEQISTSIRYAAPAILVAAVQAVLTVAALVVAAPLLGVVLVPSLVLLAFATRWYLGLSGPGYRATQAAWDETNARFQETVGASRAIESLGLGARRVAQADADITRWLATERYTLSLRTVFNPLCEAAYVLPLVLATAGGGLLAIDGRLSVSALTAATLYASLLVVPLNTVISQLDEMQPASACLARLLGVEEVARVEPTTDEPEGTAVVVEGARFAYRDGHDVLGGVDLAPRPGTTLAMVGPSGAGKTTLALLVAGIHAPTAGRVAVGGVETWRLPTDRLRHEVVLVSQEHHVFTGTLRDNLRLAAPGAGDDALLAALDVVGAADLPARLPEGLDAAVGTGAAALSPVDAQRLALARLVLADPHTLILDEATALLDPAGARHLERSLRAVLRGRTVIAVAHRLQTARDADVVAVVDGGRVVEHGTHEELLAAGGTYSELWRTWEAGG